jgi:hypothetical protein
MSLKNRPTGHEAAYYAAEKCLLRSTRMFEIRNILPSTPKASTRKNNLCSCQGGWSFGHCFLWSKT